ncbi:MAG TPA: NAD(P)-binding protein [bacterium]|nr:NAD(P)-binding protein [bacterium]
MTGPAVHLAVVGAGPAGLAAAGDAAAAGARVLLVEERPALGGRAMIVPGARGLTEGLMRELGGTEVWRNSPVWDLCHRTLWVLRGDRIASVAAGAIIVATGAREAVLPFPGWTLGGVMSLEAAWEAVRSGRVGANTGPAVVTGGADGAILANRLHERGVPVVLIAPERPPGLTVAGYAPGVVVVAYGADALEEIETADGTRHACSMLCVESPRFPVIDLARRAACPCVHQPLLGGFVPRYDPLMMLHGPTPLVFVAGDASGLDAPRAAAESGRLAARAALHALGMLPDADERIADARQRLRAASIPLHARAREALMTGAVPDEVVEPWDGGAETVVCPCESVTVGDLRAVLDEGARTPEDVRSMTGCGAGACAGRRCEAAVLRWLSGALDIPIGRLAPAPVHAPVRPVPVAALASLVASVSDG